MHMTIVRWHIFFSHFSVLPIKPWMSLSLFGDTSSFQISPSNQSNSWCVCIKAPSASNASLHPSPSCIKGGGRKAQLHFFRGRAFGCVLVVVGVGLEETLSATRILGGWGHRQHTGSSPPRRWYNHTTHIDTAPTSWHRDNEYGTESKSDFFWLVRSIRRIPPHLIPSKDYFPTRQRWDEGQQAILFSISWSELDPQIAEWGILQFGTDFLLLPRSTTILVSGKFELSE